MSRALSRSLTSALTCCLLLCAPPAGSGPLVVQAPDGSTWRVDEDEDTRLERRGADGRLDPRFGKGGRVTYTLGHSDAGTAALRVDSVGRAWVAGTSSASGASGPVVMRFLANGEIDTGWGVGGRDSAAPPGQQLVVVDLLPMPDGSVWLAGNALASPGGQHAALWRLLPDGALDFRFGAGGLWRDPGSQRSSAIGLAEAADGGVVLALARSASHRSHREVLQWTGSGSAGPRPVEAQAYSENDEEDDPPYLERTATGWRWQAGEQVAGLSGLATGTPAAAASQADPTPGDPVDAVPAVQAGFSPFSAASLASSPAATVAPVAWPWGWLLAGVLAVGALLLRWGLRVRAERRGAGADG